MQRAPATTTPAHADVPDLGTLGCSVVISVRLDGYDDVIERVTATIVDYSGDDDGLCSEERNIGYIQASVLPRNDFGIDLMALDCEDADLGAVAEELLLHDLNDGSVFDFDPVLLIERVHLDDGIQGRGIGPAAVKEFCNWLAPKYPHVLTWPEPLVVDGASPHERIKARKKLLAALTAVGFTQLTPNLWHLAP